MVLDDDELIEEQMTLKEGEANEKDEDEEEPLVIQEEVKVYPNPAIDQLHVNLGAYVGKETTLTLQNNLGQLIQSHKVTADGIFTLSVNDLQHGYYMLGVQVEGERMITKQVIIGK